MVPIAAPTFPLTVQLHVQPQQYMATWLTRRAESPAASGGFSCRPAICWAKSCVVVVTCTRELAWYIALLRIAHGGENGIEGLPVAGCRAVEGSLALADTEPSETGKYSFLTRPLKYSNC